MNCKEEVKDSRTLSVWSPFISISCQGDAVKVYILTEGSGNHYGDGRKGLILEINVSWNGTTCGCSGN